MTTSQKGIDLIKQYEGCKLKAYILPGEKYYTIGYGHSYDSDINAATVWTQAQADAALVKDLKKYENYVDLYVTIPLTQNQFDALVSYTYNRGLGGIKELATNSHTVEEYAENIVKYWGRAERYKNALIKRRKKEQALFMEGMTAQKKETPIMSTVYIAHATHDENGKYSGGRSGDQKGDEVCIRTWYNRPWTHVIRFKDANMRQKVADAMTAAAKNDRIGYDQNQRNTLLTQARKFGYDPSKVTEQCETDCSALVSLACMYAGVKEDVLYQGGNSCTTKNIRARLTNTGLVDVFSGKDYTAKTDKLVIGDILLYEGHHVAAVVKGATTTTKTTAYAEPTTTVRRGANSNNVKWVQQQLNKHGYKVDIDGDFGPATEKAVKDFQQKNDLEQDGEVGPITKSRLR